MRKLICLFLILIFCDVAFADGGVADAGVSEQEKKLQGILEKAERESYEKVNSGNVGGKSVAVVERNEKKTELIDELMKKVDALKQKESIAAAVSVAEEKPKKAIMVGAKSVYNYGEGKVYEVRAGVDRITDLELQAGEVISGSPVSGDTVRWKLNVIKAGGEEKEVTHVIVKPLEENIETNLILATDKHVYHLRLISGDWYMPSIKWNYPQEEQEIVKIKQEKERQVERLQIAPENLNFKYEIDGDSYAWKPVRVFDDGSKTYLQMKKEIKSDEAPALFLIEDEEEPMLTNYRVKGDYYIVDRLFNKAELRVGKNKKVEIEKDDGKNFFQRLF